MWPCARTLIQPVFTEGFSVKALGSAPGMLGREGAKQTWSIPCRAVLGAPSQSSFTGTWAKAKAKGKGSEILKGTFTGLLRCFPGGTVVKNPPANAGDPGDSGSILGSGRSPEEEMATHSSILGKFHEQRSMVGYSP